MATPNPIGVGTGITGGFGLDPAVNYPYLGYLKMKFSGGGRSWTEKHILGGVTDLSAVTWPTIPVGFLTARQVLLGNGCRLVRAAMYITGGGRVVNLLNPQGQLVAYPITGETVSTIAKANVTQDAITFFNITTDKYGHSFPVRGIRDDDVTDNLAHADISGIFTTYPDFKLFATTTMDADLAGLPATPITRAQAYGYYLAMIHKYTVLAHQPLKKRKGPWKIKLFDSCGIATIGARRTGNSGLVSKAKAAARV